MFYADGIHDDTLALQALLDQCGIVTIDRPGTYLVSKTLIIHSNTRLVLAPGVHLLAAPGSKCALIENEQFSKGEGRDHDIEVIGGIFDGNCDQMGLDAVYEAQHRLDDPYSPALFKGKLIRFAHIDKIMLEKLTVRNPVSYGIQIGDVRGFVTRDIFFDYNWHFGTTDGVHINGDGARIPAVLNLRIEGIQNADFVYKMDLAGVCVAAGSACASASIKPSHVLLAMGLTDERAKESVRISFGKDNTEEEVIRAAALTVQTVNALRGNR